MLDRALRRLAPLPLLALVLGCRPEPTTADPSPTPAPGPSQTIASDAEPEPKPEPDAEVEPDTTQPEAVATNTAEAQTETEPEPEPAEPSATAQREPLPKPIHKPGNGSCVKKFEVGNKVKSFKLQSLAGDKTISPAGYRNRIMLLNFWATWCKPCLAELPEFDRLYRKYRRHGMTLVAVTTDEDAKPVQDFVDKHKLSAKIALGGEGAAGEYNRSQFPFSFVVDGDGTIIAAFDYVSDECLGDLEQVIRESLETLD